MDKIYVIVNPDGKIIEDTVRNTHDSCRNDLVRDWTVPIIRDYIDNHVCWQLWSCFEKAGFSIQEIKLPKDLKLLTTKDK